MKTLRLSTISLMLSIILWGTLLGGIVYSHLVYFPVYLSALPASAVVVNGPYGLQEGTFWLLIHPILILSLLLALVLNWKVKPRRNLILISIVLYAAVLVITSLYFLPELSAFRHSLGSAVSPPECFSRGKR